MHKFRSGECQPGAFAVDVCGPEHPSEWPKAVYALTGAKENILYETTPYTDKLDHIEMRPPNAIAERKA